MKKYLLAFFVALVYINSVQSQCQVFNAVNQNNIDCGDSVVVTLNGFSNVSLSETFSLTGPNDPGWLFTSNAMYTNPYIPSPTNDTYFWMGPIANPPATLTTIPYDVSFGGQICFDFVYASGSSSPTEQPDEYDEGISLQYSLDGGLTWIDIVYYAPNGDVLPTNPLVDVPNVGGPGPFEAWQSVCITLPPGALTTSTSFQWIQVANSGSCCDNWGLDNIYIYTADPAYAFFDENWNLLPGNTSVVYPTSDSTYTYYFTDGLNDTCSTSVDLFVNETDAGPDIMVSCDGLGSPLCASGVAPWAAVTWSPIDGILDANAACTTVFPFQDQVYTLTSDCGVDSVSVFLEESYTINFSEPDTICINGATPISLTTSPSSVPIASVQWSNGASLDTDMGNQVLASPTTTTNYIVTVESDSGCVIQDSITVYVQGVATEIEITPQDPHVCLGSSLDLTVDMLVPDIPYSLVPISYSPYPITGTVVGGFSDDNVQGPLPIGFSFPYFGNNYTNIWLSSNGFFTLTANTLSSLGNQTIPTAANPNAVIAWCWDDLNWNTSGTFSYYVGGTAPNQYLVLNFIDVAHFGSATTVSVQVVLYQDGTIEMYNINVVPDNTTATMTQGIENETGTLGLALDSMNNTIFTSVQQAFAFVPYTPPANPVFSWSPGTYLNATNTQTVTCTTPETFNYTATMVDGFCTSYATVTVFVDSLVFDSLTANFTAACPEDSVQLYADGRTTVFNNLSCGGIGTCSSPQNMGQSGTSTTTSGTTSTANTGNTPFGYFYANGKRQFLLTAPELTALGFNGGNLYSLAMNITNKFSSNPFPNFAISIKCVSDATLSNITTHTGGFTEVFSSPAYSTTAGWNTFNFNQPYMWDGVSNLLVQVCFGTGTTPWHVNDHVEVSNVGFNSYAYGFNDNTGTLGCDYNGYTSTGSSTSRPNVQLSFCNVTPGYAPVSYQWSSNAGLIFDNDTIFNPLVLNDVEGGDEIYCTISDGTCTTTDTIFVGSGGYTIDGDTLICAGESAQLFASGGSAYAWTPNNGTLSSTTSANPVASPATTTNYYVAISLANCVITDSVLVQVSQLPVVSINGGNAIEQTCNGSSVSLSSDNTDPTWSYVWTGPETGSTESINVETSGNYNLTITNSFGCSDDDDISVQINDNPTLDANDVQNVLCCNESVTVDLASLISNSSQYAVGFWDGSATPSSGTETVTADEIGAYGSTMDINVTIVDQNGCEDSVTLSFQNACNQISIYNIDTVLVGESVTYQFISDATPDELIWYPIDAFTETTFTANGNYLENTQIYAEMTNTYTLNNGGSWVCQDSDTSSIYVKTIANPEMPNAFTPNGDNKNDKFFPVNLDINSNISTFNVYNRWGDLVYSYNGDNGWDGKYENLDQPADVYNYYVVIDKGIDQFVISGTVTLIR